MNKFKECNQCPHEFNDKNLEPCKDCVPKKKTNADRIRAMSDEELAEFLLKVNNAYAEPCMLSGGDCKWEDYPTHDKGCKDCFLEYLRKEAE